MSRLANRPVRRADQKNRFALRTAAGINGDHVRRGVPPIPRQKDRGRRRRAPFRGLRRKREDGRSLKVMRKHRAVSVRSASTTTRWIPFRDDASCAPRRGTKRSRLGEKLNGFRQRPERPSLAADPGHDRVSLMGLCDKTNRQSSPDKKNRENRQLQAPGRAAALLKKSSTQFGSRPRHSPSKARLHRQRSRSDHRARIRREEDKRIRRGARPHLKGRAPCRSSTCAFPPARTASRSNPLQWGPHPA